MNVKYDFVLIYVQFLVWQSQRKNQCCRWWPAEVCRLSLLSGCGIKDNLSTADAEFAVRLFGSGLLYASHHGRYFGYVLIFSSDLWNFIIYELHKVAVT